MRIDTVLGFQVYVRLYLEMRQDGILFILIAYFFQYMGSSLN